MIHSKFQTKIGNVLVKQLLVVLALTLLGVSVLSAQQTQQPPTTRQTPVPPAQQPQTQQAQTQQAPRPDALQLWRQGRFQDAVNVTLQELRENPRNMDSYTVLGWSLLDMGRWAEARDYAQQAMQVSRFDYRIIGIMAQALFNLNQNAQALQYLREYVQLQPTGARIDQMYFIMGEVYIRLGEFNRADIALTTAVHHNPRNAQWWARLGFAREQVQNFPAARTAYQQALNIQPGLAAAQQGLTRVQARL